MDFVIVILFAAVVFGFCFLVDKGFTKVFRSKAQHRSGKSIRLSKRYGSIGTIMFALGIGAIFFGLGAGWLLIAGGALIAVVGIGLVVYYLTFGVYYDEETFLLTTFGKKSSAYHYSDIQSQQLYTSGGNVVIELYMTDGRTVQLQSSMADVYTFLDHAFEKWCVQKGLDPEACTFHDPQNSCWFPPAGEN